MNNKLMTHVVAGYPTATQCIELMIGMQNAGVYAIEVQIPFSDPSADGPTIMMANDVALDNGMTVKNCFDLIIIARRQGLTCPIYAMSYANKLLSYGLVNFCNEAKNADVAGLIVPDLPFDTPEYIDLHAICSTLNLDIVPVMSPGMTRERLMQSGLKSSKLIYLTSTKGITGKEIIIQQELTDFACTIRENSNCLIALGFGIRCLEHVHMALKIADVAVIGSELIREVDQNGIPSTLDFIRRLVGLPYPHTKHKITEKAV